MSNNSIADDILIPPNCCVSNRGSGYCAWCNLEMIGRYHHLDQLYNIVNRRESLRFWSDTYKQWIEDGGATIVDLAGEMDLLKLSYHWQQPGQFDTTLISSSIKAGLPCIFSVHNYPNHLDKHSLLMTGWSDDTISFLDCNQLIEHHNQQTIIQIKTASKQWYAEHWTGAVFVPLPKPRIQPLINNQNHGFIYQLANHASKR